MHWGFSLRGETTGGLPLKTFENDYKIANLSGTIIKIFTNNNYIVSYNY